MPPTPANTARATKRWKALIGANEYQGHTSAIEYASNDSSTSWKGGDDNTIPDVAPGDPSISITMAQDTANAQSLYRLFFDSPIGTTMTFIWYPHYDDDFAITVTLTTIQPNLKTDRAGGVPEITVALPCTRAVPYTGA